MTRRIDDSGQAGTARRLRMADAFDDAISSPALPPGTIVAGARLTAGQLRQLRLDRPGQVRVVHTKRGRPGYLYRGVRIEVTGRW